MKSSDGRIAAAGIAWPYWSTRRRPRRHGVRVNWLQVEERAERGRRHQHRQAERGRRGSGRRRQQAPAAQVAPALGDDLRELRGRLGFGIGVLALELLGHHQVPARHDERGGQEPEGAAEGEPEVLGLVGDAVDCVDDDEPDRAQRRKAEERGDRELGARRRWARRDDPRRSPLRRRMPACAQSTRRPPPQTSATAASREPPSHREGHADEDDPATNHATRPSGTGPTWPSDHPPRSYGASVYRT